LAAAPLEVGGETVRLITLDDQTDTTAALKDARKLIEESNVDLLLSPPDSPSVFALVPLSHDAKVPLISLSTAAVPGEPGEWMITIPQPLPLMLSADIDHMRKTGVKRLAYIGFGDAWGDAVYNALKAPGRCRRDRDRRQESYARADTSVTARCCACWRQSRTRSCRAARARRGRPPISPWPSSATRGRPTRRMPSSTPISCASAAQRSRV